MARKVANITITDEGRDKGKVFVLKELPASRAEKWATRAFLALARSGVEIPEGVEKMGLAGIATLSLKALGGVTFSDAEPLLDEMMACVSIMLNPAKPDVVRALIEDDIEEIATRITLRKEVARLHVDFSTAADLLKSSTSAATGASTQNT